jgi:valyl-tRNA synthetase
MEQDMKDIGLFVNKTPKEMVLGKCLKTGDIIEPLIKP